MAIFMAFYTLSCKCVSAVLVLNMCDCSPSNTQVQQDPKGSMAIFMAFYTLSVVLMFPCMIMQVICGALYGFMRGFLVRLCVCVCVYLVWVSWCVV